MDDEVRVPVVRLVVHQFDEDGKPVREESSQPSHGVLEELLGVEVVDRKQNLIGILFSGEELELFQMSVVPNRSDLEILVLLRRKGDVLGAHEDFRSVAIGTAVQRDLKAYMTRIEGDGWKEKRTA